MGICNFYLRIKVIKKKYLDFNIDVLSWGFFIINLIILYKILIDNFRVIIR